MLRLLGNLANAVNFFCIQWETLEQDHLQLQSDQLFAKAKGCIEKGEERSAAEIAAAAIEILMLAHTDENGDYAQ